jgi:TPR repeat protein
MSKATCNLPKYLRNELEHPEYVRMSTNDLVEMFAKYYTLPEASLQLYQRFLAGRHVQKKYRDIGHASRSGHPVAAGITMMDTDMDAAFNVFSESYRRGHPTAAYYLAKHFYCLCDPVEMYTFAAEKGCVDSMFELYCHYEFRDAALSIKWLEKAAKLDHPFARYHLAMRYLYVYPRQPTEAVNVLKNLCYTAISDRNLVDAIHYESGRCHELGIGTPKDIKKAKEIYDLPSSYISDHGVRCSVALGILTRKKHRLEEAAKIGHIEAQYHLGMLEESGRKVFWLTRAADKGHRDARVELARYCRKNHPERAKVIVKDLAESGYAPAQYLLGRLTPSEVGEENVFIRRAADQGYPEAMYKMGKRLYDQSKYKKALSWLLKYARAVYDCPPKYIKPKRCLSIADCYCTRGDLIADGFWYLEGEHEDLESDRGLSGTSLAILRVICSLDNFDNERVYADHIYDAAVAWLNDHPLESEIAARSRNHREATEAIRSALPGPIAEEIIPCFVSFFLKGTPSVFGYECGTYPPAGDDTSKRALEDTHNSKRQRLQ